MTEKEQNMQEGNKPATDKIDADYLKGKGQDVNLANLYDAMQEKQDMDVDYDTIQAVMKEAVESEQPENPQQPEKSGSSKPKNRNRKKKGRRKNSSRKNSILSPAVKEALSWILTCVVAVGIALFLKTFIIITANVPTGSMENTITPGDNLVGYRLSYLNSDPQRGDIVIFYNPDNTEEKFIKRVIGLPGETVTIEDAVVYVDGEPLQEDYLKEEWITANDGYVFEIPEDSYLMLGDNRNGSSDARFWTNTYVSRDMIIAKALWVYWPLSDCGALTETPDYGLDKK